MTSYFEKSTKNVFASQLYSVEDKNRKALKRHLTATVNIILEPLSLMNFRSTLCFTHIRAFALIYILYIISLRTHLIQNALHCFIKLHANYQLSLMLINLKRKNIKVILLQRCNSYTNLNSL